VLVDADEEEELEPAPEEIIEEPSTYEAQIRTHTHEYDKN